MIRFRCPYCQVILTPKPELAGQSVSCSKCKGEFYEPTDPVPGLVPEKVPSSEDPLPTDLPKVVASLKKQGLNSIILTWPADDTRQVKMTFPNHLTAEKANDVIVQIALRLM